MEFVLHVYHGDKKQEIELNGQTPLRVGTTAKDDVVFPAPGHKIRIVVAADDGGAAVRSNVAMQISGKTSKKGNLAPDESCVISRSPFVGLALYVKRKDSQKTVNFANVSRVTIGRNPDMNIRLKSPRVTGDKHAVIRRSESALVLIDSSTNGTYVNGERIKEHVMRSGDIISIAGYRLIFSSGILLFGNVGDDLTLNITEASAEFAEKAYPFFQVSPRLNKELPGGEIDIQAPPNLGAKPEINWLSVLLPPIAMVAVMGAAAYLMNSAASLIYTAPMTLISLSVSIVNFSGQRKKHCKAEAARFKRYVGYLEGIAGRLSQGQNIHRAILSATHPDLPECLRIVKRRQRRLWERRPSEKDFMSLKLGLGETPFGITIKTPKMNAAAEYDSLAAFPDNLRRKYEKVAGVPICVELLKYPTVGIVGDRADSLTVAKNLIVQAATHHSYEEVKIAALFNRNEAAEWSWVRWLPHSWDDSRAARYMADTKSGATALLKEFEETVKQRERELKGNERRDKDLKLPFILFVVADKRLIENESIMAYLTRNDPNLGIGALLLFDDISYLPPGNAVIVEAKRGEGALCAQNNMSDIKKFGIEMIDRGALDAFARNMAPIRIKSIVAENRLPGCVTFFQGYGVKKPEEIEVGALWSRAVTYKSMAAPIGVKSNGDKFMFDIWERAHGPFGQVAGMPGSGKSEMVQTWILSMAFHFSPRDVSFVLIDFKGTGLLKPFADMPHIAGTISDIDKNISRNLIALESEMKRRKELFDANDAQSIEDYLKLLHQGKVTEPCPFMIIVVDEFAEMKVQFPDFMPVVDSLFGIGRSLGMYCVLMSQKPGGVVSAKVEANTKFRWCLRVASAAESKEMTGHPEASKITVPGRGYVKVGDDEIFELIQSYWSGAPYDPDAEAEAVSSVNIATVDIGGKRYKCESVEKAAGTGREDVSEINAAVRFLDSYVRETGVGRAKPVWTPKLKDVVGLDEILDGAATFDGERWPENPGALAPAIGMIDDPRLQAQYPLKLNLAEDGNIAVFGAPQTGKTTLLQTLALSLAYSYTPQDVNIYVMDFGSWELGALSALPHVGGVALGGEEEKITSLARLLLNILQERRQGFITYGVNSIKAYAKAAGKPVPCVVLLLDDFAPVLEQYPELESFFMTLARSGSGYGMYLIATASTISGMPYRIRQNIKQNIALQMIDKTDYLEIVGRAPGLELDKVLGRGLIKGKPPLEFQTAYAVARGAEFPEIALSLGRKMSAAWAGARAPTIPVMPDIVTRSDFSDIPEGAAPLGLTADLEQVFFGGANKTALVSGSERSGKTNALKALASLYAGAQDQTTYWFDGAGNFTAYEGIVVIRDCAEMEKTLETLADVAYARKETNGTSSPTVLIIDNLPAVLPEISEGVKKRLESIVNDRKAASPRVYVSGEYNELSLLYAQQDAVLLRLLAGGVSIVTGGALSSQRYITPGAEISYTEQAEELPEFWGYYTAKGKTRKIKLMLNTESGVTVRNAQFSDSDGEDGAL
ncbi:MAG: type VII secretion protein EssC [Oscillospiraceae bacterium]|nr:type VII secretion protein EssC [Oscillospiraceae bacterium]